MFDDSHTPPAQVDLKKTYDAIVVGSGAAGGMAAHVLTSHGLEVLLLEAGKKLPIEQELRSMQWPYNHPRRGEMPPSSHGLTLNEYTIRKPPYARGMPYPHVYSYVQTWGASDYSKNIVVDEKDHPYTGTNYAWVRARLLGGKTAIWGRLALRLSDLDFKAASRDGFGEDWPISYSDIEPYYDKVDTYLGISGLKENLPYLPDSLFQRPNQLTHGRDALPGIARKNGAADHALPRGRDHGRAEAQQIPQQMFRPRRVQPARGRLRHSRGIRFADGADLSRLGHRAADRAHQRHGFRSHHRRQYRQGQRRVFHRHGNAQDVRRPRRGRWCWARPRWKRRG